MLGLIVDSWNTTIFLRATMKELYVDGRLAWLTIWLIAAESRKADPIHVVDSTLSERNVLRHKATLRRHGLKETHDEDKRGDPQYFNLLNNKLII
jgi:hypothetical protein